MLTQEQLLMRRNGIGGSESAAALGLSRYKSPFQLYLEKIGEIEDDNQGALVKARGNRFEPILREMYAEKTGRKVELAPTFQSDKVPFMFVTPDGLTNDGRYLEIKTARNRHEWGEPGSDELPDEYKCQIQHGLFVTRLQVADVFVAFSLDNIELYEVHADPELQDMIIDGEKEFWNHVESRNPPELATYEDVIKRYRRASGKAIQITSGIERYLNQLRLYKEMERGEKDVMQTCKAEIMKFMGEHDTLIDSEGKPLITWKETKERQSFDDKAFKEAHPELWAQFLKPATTQRRFLIKG